MTEIVAEIASLKEMLKSSDRRIDVLEDSVRLIPKMETLLEITIETNKKQSDTLDLINANLTRLNNNYDNLTHRIGAIEDDIRISRGNSSININKLTTDTISKMVPSILGGIILAWLFIKFGLK